MNKFRTNSTAGHTPPFSVAVLMCAVRNSLRPFLVHPEARFKALLQMPDGLSSESMLYYLAVTEVLGADALYDESGIARLFVARLDEISIVSSLKKIFEAERTVLLCGDLDELDPEIKLITDFEIVLGKPSAAHFLAAARMTGLKDMTRSDAEYLASIDFGKVKMALNGHRTLRSAIGRLRRAGAANPRQAKPLSPPEQAEKAVSTLRQVTGYGNAASWGLQLAEDLAAWQAGQIDWEDVDRGAVLYGRPGTGKTTYGRILAATCGVPIIETSSARWQATGHLGDMLKAMRKSFEEAQKRSPCILFIDEFDAFGDRNSDTAGDNQDYKRQVINGLLECLDPPGGRRGVVVVAATNFPDVIDPALLRPGRLERLIGIPLPDASARVAILRQHLRGLEAPEDLRLFQEMSSGLAGADIELVAREVRRRVRKHGRQLEEQDLLDALPPSRTLSDEELWRVAVHEAGHALATQLAGLDQLLWVAINRRVPLDDRGSSLGHVEIQRKASVIETEDSLMARIDIHLAGIAAERVVFGHHSTSGGGAITADLRVATDLATTLERFFGFGEHLVLDMGRGAGALEMLRAQDAELWHAVDIRLKTSLQKTELRLRDHQATLVELGKMLVEKGSLSGIEVRELVALRREVLVGAPSVGKLPRKGSKPIDAKRGETR